MKKYIFIGNTPQLNNIENNKNYVQLIEYEGNNR